MQVSIDHTEGLKRSLKIAVPAKRVEQEIHSKLSDLTRTAKISGFRPGKIPFKIVEKRYGEQVRQQVVSDVLRQSFEEALSQEKLTPATGPEIEPLCMEPGKDLEYRAKFEVIPEINLKKLSELKIKIPHGDIADEDISNAIEEIRKGNREWIEVDRPAIDGDQLLIDYEGQINNEIFAGGSAQNVKIVLGNAGFLPEFESALQNAKKDQDITFPLKFPDDYGSKDVAGKTAEFKVKVHQVSEGKLPELNADFMAKLGIENGDKDKLNQVVRNNMEKRVEQILRPKKREVVLQALFDANPLELPEGLIKQDCERLLHESKSKKQQPAEQADDKELTVDDFKDKAKRRVALSLIMSQIISEHKLEPKADRVKEFILSIAQNAPNPEEIVRQYYSNKEIMGELESIVLEEQVVDCVIEGADVSTETRSYKDLTGPQ